MIAYFSPEGEALRALQPSRSAIAAIWFNAVDEGRGDWASWASDELATRLSGADLAAMKFVQAASDGDMRRAHQLWAVLGTIPADGPESRFLRAARDLRASLPF